jgi:DNA-directed RNA polymerase specialized sigma24 family protein
VEETELMMGRLSALHRRILELSLQGLNVVEVAQQAACTERTVERAIKLARNHLETRLFSDVTP